MTLYIGVDFHPHQQTISWIDTETGETKLVTLMHNRELIREYYESLPAGIVGIEATSKASWFEKIVTEAGHSLLVANPELVRKRATSRHKSDKRDAQLLMQLLVRGEFPVIWRRSVKNTQVLEILKARSSRVNQRTQIYNRLQAIAHDGGLAKGKAKTKAYQDLIWQVELDEAGCLNRKQLFEMLAKVNEQIEELENWLKRQAEGDQEVKLLMTQPGVGPLTGLAVINTIGDISRFERPTKQIPAFVGLEPLEEESAGKKKATKISRAGSWLVRYLLGQAAHLAIRYDPDLKSFYKRLAKHKPKPVAKTATARKLLVKLTIMLRDKITAQEFDRRGRTVNDTRRSAGSEMAVA